MNTTTIMTAAFAAAFTASAFAGETMAPSKQVVPPAPVLYGTGWYGGIQAGANVYQDLGNPNRNVTNVGVPGGILSLTANQEVGFFAGLKLGYVFGTGNVRLALEEDMYYNTVEPTVTGFFNATPLGRAKTRLNSGAFLTNFLVRFNCVNKFQPYVGGGVGFYVGEADDLRVTPFGGGFNNPVALNQRSNTQTGFAWQLVAGADYYFTPKFSTFLEYKFLNYEDSIFGDRLGQQLIGAGVRVHF